ncbi:MAG: tRNA preQ1(34) S-adenosylmethionine ribosyltransferase-isomerase QueA [Bdellovibrionota bacterium]
MLFRRNFFYHIPPELIAQNPIDRRDSSRLLVCNAANKSIEDRNFYEIPQIVNEKFHLSKNNGKALFIINDTRVYPARVRIARQTGARGEVFILNRTPTETNSYNCLLRPQSKLKIGETLFTDSDNTSIFKVTNLNPPQVSLLLDESLEKTLEKYGEMPLPPYIDRDPKRVAIKKNLDKERYQTVYSDQNKLGSSAAPTAGLHFTEETMLRCKNAGIEFTPVTLHVGLGTFSPVQTDEIEKHSMHEEFFCVSHSTLQKICEYLQNNWPIIYVGTTSLRAVESFFRILHTQQQDIKKLTKNNELLPTYLKYADSWHATKLFLYPQSKSHKISPCIGNAIITNFHQPESTLAMLVAALMGYEFWQEFYSYAIANKYRFFSYGDSSLLMF